MLKAHQLPAFAPNAPPQALRVGQQHLAVVNLRGNARDPAFVLSVQQALGLALPVSACTTLANQRLRLVWVGPDDWFVLGPQGEQAALDIRRLSCWRGVVGRGRAVDGDDFAVDAEARGTTHADVQVRSAILDHGLQQLIHLVGHRVR